MKTALRQLAKQNVLGARISLSDPGEGLREGIPILRQLFVKRDDHTLKPILEARRTCSLQKIVLESPHLPCRGIFLYSSRFVYSQIGKIHLTVFMTCTLTAASEQRGRRLAAASRAG